jgi:hypothetical protein
MAGETSEPSGQDTVDQMEEENAIAGMTDAQSQAQMSEMGLSGGFGNYAGSTSLSNQQSGSITGSNLMDALVPGVGTLSVISSLNASYMQQSMQRGASPVYGSRGTVEGVVNETSAFGTTFSTYSGNPDLDPIGGGNRGGNDPSTPSIVSSRVAAPVKAPAATVRTASYNPNEAVDAYGMQSKKGRGSGRKDTIMTSAQGDTSQLKTILRPGLKGTLG